MTLRPRPAVAALALLVLTGCASAPRPTEFEAIAERAARYALEMEGKPYRYGGSSPRQGFDCSGLVHYSYARAGVNIARTTDALYRSSRRIPTAHLRPGDLLFFNQEGKRASHVGIYLGGKRFVHAPSGGKRVTVGSLSQPYWRQHLESARRLVLN